MKILCITTFNRDGLEKYGRAMVESWLRNWEPSGEVHLALFLEGCEPEDVIFPIPPKVMFFDLATSSPWLADFKTRNAWRNVNDFKHEAIRFSHKIAALDAAFKLASDWDYVIWLDADTLTHCYFKVAELKSLLPTAEWIAWLDRRALYPECGFMIFNTKHAMHPVMVAALREMYEGDRLFSLLEWHDSYVMGYLVNSLNAPAKSLSGGEGWRTSHPLVNGPLGKWFDHLKGFERKTLGRSKKTDLRVKREEAYWQ